MARLQILELPEGSGDDRPPFVLVIDQAPRDERSSAFRDDLVNNEIADRTGARHVLVFEDTIDIPANDTTAYLQQVAEETGATIGKITSTFNAQMVADERTDIARDMDRLAKRKDELLDALGMDSLRNWDDIVNAARGLRQDRDEQAAAVQRVRDRHRPVDHRGETICMECSACDFAARSTDNAPVAYDQCVTLKALAGYPATNA